MADGPTPTSAFEIFSNGIARLQTRVAILDSMVIDKAKNVRLTAFEAADGIIVASAALEEQLFQGILISTEAAINSSTTLVGDLIPPLRAFLNSSCVSRPDRLGAELGRAYGALEVCSPSMPHVAAKVGLSGLAPSGRTIRSNHFVIVGRALGLTRAPFPSPNAQVAVNRLADLRNEIAHGSEDADSIRSKLRRQNIDLFTTLTDVSEACRSLTVDVQNFCDHHKWK